MSSVWRQKVLFRFRRHYLPLMASWFRSGYWRALGMHVGRNVRMHDLRVTWPHRVSIGDSCSFEHNIYFNCAGGHKEEAAIVFHEGCFVGNGCEFNITKGLRVGANTLIASGTRFIDHDHGMDSSVEMKFQGDVEEPIIVGADVWIGVNCVVLKGVTIGDGAIIAAGSVVTKSIAPLSVNAGVPARMIRPRNLGVTASHDAIS